MALGWFQPSVLGMQGHSHALAVISNNIANMTTTGYKQSDTAFKTLVSRDWSAGTGDPSIGGPLNAHADIGGVRGVDYARVSQQGAINGTGRAFDVAIAGDGFFTLDSALNGGGERVFGRAGDFSVGLAGTRGDEGYLVDANGYFVQGYPLGAGNSGAGTGQPGAIRIDAGAFTDQGQPTRQAALALNLPSGVPAGSAYAHRFEVFDAGSKPRSFDLSFTRASEANTWAVTVRGAAGEAVAIEPAGEGGAPGEGVPLRFDPQGAVIGPRAYALRVADSGAAGGDAVAFSLDLSGLTQYAGGFVFDRFTQDGAGVGNLEGVSFDDRGLVIGTFDNGRSRPLYALALADFANPDGLDGRNGTVFAATAQSGAPIYGRAGTGGIGTVSPGALELSNVDLEEQFSRMILTQNAYNSSATALKTVDEMTETARDLKR